MARKQSMTLFEILHWRYRKTPQALYSAKGAAHHNASITINLNVLNNRVAGCKKYNLQEMWEIENENTTATGDFTLTLSA